MARLRSDAQFGTLSAAATQNGVTLSSAQFAGLPVVESPDYLAITLDPEETGGPAEIVWVTVHAAGSSSVTVARSEEGTAARSHGDGTKWAHAPTATDFEALALIGKTGASELTLSGNLILNGSPTGTNQAATKGYVDSVAAGQRFKDACRVATTGPITIATKLVANQTVDDVTLVAGDRVLVKDQTTLSQNGIYVVAPLTTPASTPSRATDADSSAELDSAAVFVIFGTQNQSTSWVQTTNNPTVDSSAIVWAQTGGGRTNADDETLIKVGSTMSIKDSGVTIGKISGSTGATAAQYLNGVGGWTTPTASGLDWTIVSGTTLAALQSARGTYPGAVGRRVYVPAGTYTLTGKLTLQVPNQTWDFHPEAKLVNATGSVLELSRQTTAASDGTFPGADGVTITGGIFDGGSTSRLIKGNNSAVQLIDVNDVTLRDVTVKDASYFGIYSQNATKVRLDRCTVLNSGGTGILHTQNTASTRVDSEDIWVDGCVVDRTEWHQASLHGGGIKIIGDQNGPEDALNCDVSVSADTFTYVGHPLGAGDEVRLANITGVTGFTAVSTSYYVVNVTTNTFKLAATAGGTAIDVGGTDGTADVYQVVDASASSAKRRLVGVTTDVSTNTFTSTGHGMSNGWRVRVEQPVSTTNLDTDRDYFVVGATSNTFQLSWTRGGTAIDLTGSNGTCWIRVGNLQLRRVKVTNCDVRLPDLVNDSGAGNGNESIMCQENTEADVLFSGNTTRGGSMGVSISGPKSVAVTNNVCTRFSKHGIEIAGVRDFTVVGNVVDGATEETAPLYIVPSTVSGGKVISVTGSASTNTLTYLEDGAAPSDGHGLANGAEVIFSARTGGSSIVLGERYYVVEATSSTFKLSTSKGGAAITLGSDLTAATFTATSCPDHGVVIWVESADSNRFSRRGVVVGNTIRRIDETSGGKGIRISDPNNGQDTEGSGPKRANVTVANNVISVGGGAYGVQAIDVSGVTITGNQIDCAESGSAAGIAVRLTSDDTSLLENVICSNNQFYGAGTAVHLNTVGTATLQHVVFRDNIITDCGDDRTIDAAFGIGSKVTWWGNRGNSATEPDDEALP